MTFASGPYLTGCSNCSMTEFGCCEDNVTEAEGPMKEGCPEFVEEPEGSGEDNETTTEEPMGERSVVSVTSALESMSQKPVSLFRSPVSSIK